MHQPIDINTWERREIYQHFSRMKTPHYAVAGNIDVTPLLAYKRKHHLSFYLSSIWPPSASTTSRISATASSTPR